MIPLLIAADVSLQVTEYDLGALGCKFEAPVVEKLQTNEFRVNILYK